MSGTAHDIQLALRLAAGHARAATDAETEGSRQYEMKMKSAGASAYEAFTLAIKAAPEYAGRKIDDKAIARIYQSNKPRPWWDTHLVAVKVEGKPATRDWAKRTILWHLDPTKAVARRAAQNSMRASNHAKLQGKSAGQGRRQPQRAPTTAEARKVHEAGQDAVHAGRELPKHDAPAVTANDLLGEVSRIQAAVRKVSAEDRGTVLEVLRLTAREIEGYKS